jgi:hypothetical protein
MLSFVRPILGIALLAFAGTAFAEDRAPDAGRLLPRTEGIVLADRALEYPPTDPWPDCSHLVHQVLNDAGLEYPYATSHELYDGVPQFRRVRRPQPGDLIVWRGHVGFVVDPKNHRFFSSTSSGPRTDNYQSDYWRRRGIARFYRYVTNSPTQLVARASKSGPTKRISDRPVEAASDDVPDQPATEPVAEAIVAWRAPESLAIESRNRQLSKADLENALAGYLKSTTPALEAGHSQDLAVVLVRRAQVKKVYLKDELGWAEIRFDSRAQLTPDGTWNKTKAEKARWSLRRDEAGTWQLLLPQDRIYIAQDAAIPTLAHELSSLSGTRAPATTARATTLAAVLNLLKE